MVSCKLALDLNGRLVSADQCEYQMALESTYAELLTALEAVLGTRILHHTATPAGGAGNRSSQASDSSPYLSLLGHHVGQTMDC